MKKISNSEYAKACIGSAIRHGFSSKTKVENSAHVAEMLHDAYSFLALGINCQGEKKLRTISPMTAEKKSNPNRKDHRLICLIRKVDWEKYQAACKAKGTYPSRDLREHIDAKIIESHGK